MGIAEFPVVDGVEEVFTRVVAPWRLDVSVAVDADRIACTPIQVGVGDRCHHEQMKDCLGMREHSEHRARL